MVVSVAVPVAAMLAPMLPVAFTVNVVLMTAAEAAAHTSRAKAKIENVRFIGLSESSTHEAQNAGIFGSCSTAPVPGRRADFKSLPLARVLVYSLPLSLAQSAIDGENLTCNEIRRLQKIHHGVGNFGGGAATPRRGVLDHALAALVDVFEGDRAGGDGIHGNFGSEGLGERAGEHDDAGFGSAVVGVLRPGTDATQGTDVDDAAIALPLHEARRLLAAEEDRLEVDGVDEVPIPLGDVERVEAGEAGGVVDQAVEAPEALLDIGEQGRDLRHGFQVGAENFGAATIRRGAARFAFGVVIVDGDACAFFGETQRDAAADAFGAAGDEDGFAGKGRRVHDCGADPPVCGRRPRRLASLARDAGPGGPARTRGSALHCRFAMDFDLLGIHAFADRVGQAAGEVGPAPEYRGGGEETSGGEGHRG